MNQPPHPVGEQNINLTGFNDRGYLSFAKVRMHHCLAAAICPSAVVRCPNPSRNSESCADLVRDSRSADRTTYPAYLSLFGDGSDDMTAFTATSNAHLFDSIADSEVLFLFHSSFASFFKSPGLRPGINHLVYPGGFGLRGRAALDIRHGRRLRSAAGDTRNCQLLTARYQRGSRLPP